MGDRFDRKARGGWRHPGLKSLKPPSELISRGLTQPGGLGHNQGPPLDEPVADAFVRYRWRKAHREVWKNPPLSILKLRVARAEAAGLTYREYMLELLDSGRHLTAEDVARRRGAAAMPWPLGPADKAGPPEAPAPQQERARPTRNPRKPQPL